MGYIGSGPTRFNTADELTVTGDAEFNGNLTVKGTTTTIDSASVQTIDLGDNDKIRLGDSDDLQIFHDGFHSYIHDAGTGNLRIAATNFYVYDQATSVLGLAAIANDRVEINYAGSKKFATTSGGIDVTGTVTADGLTVGDGHTIQDDGNDNLTISSSTGEFVIVEGAGGVLVRQGASDTNAVRIADGGDISFYDSTGTTQGLFWDASTQRLGLGETAPEKPLHINGGTLNVSARIESTDAISMMDFVDSNTTVAPSFGAQTNDLIFYTNNSEKVRVTSGGNVGIGDSSPYEWSSVQPSLNLRGTSASFPNRSGALIFKSQAGTHMTVMDFETGNDLRWYQSSNSGSSWDERMRLDSSGNVGVGTAAPATLLHTQSSVADAQIRFESTHPSGISNLQLKGAGSATIRYLDESGTIQSRIDMRDSGFVSFHDSSSQKMTLDSSGNLLVGTISNIFNSRQTTRFESSGVVIGHTFWNGGGSGQKFTQFINSGGGLIGSITQSGASSTSYNTSSDYRLKENVTDITDATTRLKQLNPVRFNFIADADTTVDGFLAHEVQDIVPEAITGTKDAMRDEEYEVSAATGDIYTPATEAILDEDGNEVTPAVAEVIHSTDVERPEELAEGQQWRETTAVVMGTRSVPDYQGIDQSKLVPLLVKTIQELEARIVALETA
jgi:hypothetical protein